MSKAISDGMKTAVYQKMLLSGDWNASNIIKRFKGADYIKAGVKHTGTGKRSAYGMRKTEALEVMRGLKRTNAEVMGSPDMEGMGFMERMDKSDLFEHKGPGFRAKMQKDALKVGRREALATSRRGKRTGKKAGTVKDMRDRMFKNVDASEDYVEFYG